MSSSSGLPSGWEVRHSNSKNLPYYFNPSTKESRWEPPSGADTEKLKTYMANHHSAGINPAGSSASAAAAAAAPSSTSSSTAGKIRTAHLLVKHSGSRRPSSWRQSEITRSKDEALDIIGKHRERIAAGEVGLPELAKTESDCSSARKGGDLGYFGRGDMQKEFEEAAFALEPGEMSGIVETASGVHLILRID